MNTLDSNNGDDFFDRGTDFNKILKRNYRVYLDSITPYVAPRWVFSGIVLILFMARVLIGEGWYLICYTLGIYYLNLLIDFLSPRIDPGFSAAQDDVDPDSGPSLPTSATDEFKPFIRRLPEFKFWLHGTYATLISLFLSMFHMFDLPVFWPVLLIYFIVLTLLTLRRQIQHMYKYHYVPWTTGKQNYGRS